VDVLEIFDGTIFMDDIGPTVYHFWYRELAPAIFEDELGAELTAEYLPTGICRCPRSPAVLAAIPGAMTFGRRRGVCTT